MILLYFYKCNIFKMSSRIDFFTRFARIGDGFFLELKLVSTAHAVPRFHIFITQIHPFAFYS